MQRQQLITGVSFEADVLDGEFVVDYQTAACLKDADLCPRPSEYSDDGLYYPVLGRGWHDSGGYAVPPTKLAGSRVCR
jgi:hypothetical protein